MLCHMLVPFFWTSFARRWQPPKDEEMEEGTEQLVGLIVIPPLLRDEEVIKISAEEVAQWKVLSLLEHSRSENF